MNYQIGIVGTGIILAYSAVILLIIVWPLQRLLRKLRWKWIVVAPIALMLLAAPWAEEYWIAYHFEQACQDAGVHVYKQVEVEGFYDATGGGISRPGLLTSQAAISSFENGSYKFYERLVGYDPKASPLKVSHVEKTDGQWQISILDHPTARYHYQYAYQPTPYKQEEPIGWKLEKLGTIVVDSKTGEIIARDADYRRTINIAEGSWRLFWGLATTSCTIRPTEHLPIAALKSISKLKGNKLLGTELN